MTWLGDSRTALWCVAVTLIWQAVGYYMVMYIAAIDGISADVFESATIDGAGYFRKLVSITIPLLKEIIGITFVLSLAGTINLSFIVVTIMTGVGRQVVLLYCSITCTLKGSKMRILVMPWLSQSLRLRLPLSFLFCLDYLQIEQKGRGEG